MTEFSPNTPRILILEEDPIIRDAVKQAFHLVTELPEDSITTASNPDEAREILENNPQKPDTIILDPEAGGNRTALLLLDEIRQNRDINLRHIYILSSEATPSTINFYLEQQGVSGIIEKPFELTDIQRVANDIRQQAA